MIFPYAAPQIRLRSDGAVEESVKNRTLGSIFIVAGTTIGAGMLAMPLAAAGVGFGVTLLLLVGLWALMCYTALLLLEVYQHVPADTGLGSLAARYLGRYGQWITGFSMMFLMYALTAAYMSGAGELIASSVNDWFGSDISPATGVLFFTLIGGGVVCVGTSLVNLFNRFLFSAKIVFLVVMLALLAPHVHKVNLLTLPLEQGLALSAIPVIFTSFGFHGSVPSIVSYMNGDIRKLRRVFIIGSAVPLIAYIFWQLVTLGSIGSSTFMGLMADHSGLNGFLQALREVVASPHVELAVHLFADLALATSFLGVALGLFDYLANLSSVAVLLQGVFKRASLPSCHRWPLRCSIRVDLLWRWVTPVWRYRCLPCCSLPFSHGEAVSSILTRDIGLKGKTVAGHGVCVRDSGDSGAVFNCHRATAEVG